jgi:hypothetical protein
MLRIRQYIESNIILCRNDLYTEADNIDTHQSLMWDNVCTIYIYNLMLVE